MDGEIDAALNADFLRQLVTLAKQYGWQGDYLEVIAFVLFCHERFGVAPPNPDDFTPFEEEP